MGNCVQGTSDHLHSTPTFLAHFLQHLELENPAAEAWQAKANQASEVDPFMLLYQQFPGTM